MQKLPFRFIVFAAVAASVFLPRHSYAQSAYGIPIPNVNQPEEVMESTFSIQTGEMSCSSGGGTPPSLYLGVQSGMSDLDSFYESNIDQRDDFLSGGVGLTIPLSSPSNKSANCETVLSIIEAHAFLDMMERMNKLGVLDKERALAMTVQYMRIVGDELGIDLEESFLNAHEMLELIKSRKKGVKN